MTSGSTLAECARTMLDAGASHVTVLPLAKNQRVIWPAREVPCTDANCQGTFSLRINNGHYGAFWGCTRFPDCREVLSWEEGHRRLTALNGSHEIGDARDVPF